MSRYTILLLLLTFNVNAGIAFFKYESVNGMYKICVYDYLGSDVAITIKSYQLCPLTINQED